MKTLIKSIEEWVDQRVFANNEYFVTKFKAMEEIHIRDANRIADLERRVALWIYEGDTARLDSVDSRLDDLECSMDEKIDSSDVDDKIESALADLDLPDAYSVEVMIDDALETKVMDAVRAELDATDFKITVER